MTIDVTPDPEEIMQSEEGYDRIPPIPVSVCAPVETRELPAKRGGYTTYSDVSTSGVQALSFEPRRKSATIISHEQDMWIGSSQQAVIAGGYGAFKAPSLVPITIDHMDAVWVASVTGTSDISVTTSYWSD